MNDPALVADPFAIVDDPLYTVDGAYLGVVFPLPLPGDWTNQEGPSSIWTNVEEGPNTWVSVEA
jgi:hypothetical protein